MLHLFDWWQVAQLMYASKHIRWTTGYSGHAMTCLSCKYSKVIECQCSVEGSVLFEQILYAEFYVLLTVHLGIVLVNNQLDAQFFFLIRLFQFSTCFEQHSAHHQENQLYQYNFWYMSHCVGDRLVCRSGRNFPTCTQDGRLHSV